MDSKLEEAEAEAFRKERVRVIREVMAGLKVRGEDRKFRKLVARCVSSLMAGTAHLYPKIVLTEVQRGRLRAWIQAEEAGVPLPD